MIRATEGKPGEGMTLVPRYVALCQDCGTVHTFATEALQMAAHRGDSACGIDGCEGELCACLHCVEGASLFRQFLDGATPQ